MKRSLIYFFAGFIFGFAAIYFYGSEQSKPKKAFDYNDSKFGNWLAAQHAIFRNDFETANGFLDKIKKEKSKDVQNARSLVIFLDGGAMPKNAVGIAGLITNAASLAKSDKWKELYSLYKNDNSQVFAPFHIWSAVGANNSKAAIDFVNKMPYVSPSWKNFTLGSIYASANDSKNAREYFKKVSSSFMNLSDYNLVMSFYKKYGYKKDAAALKNDWVSSVGGMYMANLEMSDNWENYDNIQKMLSASIVQNVSHSGEDSWSDVSLLMLRISGLLGGAEDSIDYYTGGYFYASGSDDYKKYWGKLKNNPIYRPFVEMKVSEISGNPDDLELILKKNPLFAPAIIKSWKQSIIAGNERKALLVINHALGQKNIPESGRAYLLKMRGHTFYIFGDLESAEKDLNVAIKLAPMDAEIMGLISKVWAAEKKNLDQAYSYGISLIRAFPSSVSNWNSLAMVVKEKESPKAALEILEKIGNVANECSELFLNLGDLRLKFGNRAGAAEAYNRALVLSDDGLVVRSEIEKKLKKIIKDK